ncbi:MAG: hypothetical protein KAH38_06485 [Candidatus Hydrogenedentes bacterium]|nr:hypothetical protein [Candidatus Hydrogenedentota bacterium]
MLPGPVIIHECPVCSNLIEQNTLASGNTFGARFWTDGKMDAPMLPDQAWLVKCEHCSALVWLDEKTEERIIPQPSEEFAKDWYKAVRTALTPTQEDYKTFLAGGMRGKKKQRYVRICAWWVGNDSRRESDQEKPLDSFEIENLRALVTLLKEKTGNDRIMKAEALRELGEFADAEKLLATKFNNDLKEAVAIIRNLNQKKITTVAEMKSR